MDGGAALVQMGAKHPWITGHKTPALQCTLHLALGCHVCPFYDCICMYLARLLPYDE